MARAIRWQDLPRVMGVSQKDMRRAAAWTLNTLAFDSLPEIVGHAERQLDISRNARRALGMQVLKKAKASDVEAQVGTKRGWLYYHLNSGRRGPVQGYRFRGRKYLIYPLDDRFVTKRGRLRAAVVRRMFAVETAKGGMLLMHVRGEEVLVGLLVRQFKHRKAFSPEDIVADLMRSKATRLMRRGLEREVGRAS